MIARLSEDQRNQAVCMLSTGSTENITVHHFGYSKQTIHNFVNWNNITGSVRDRARPSLACATMCILITLTRVGSHVVSVRIHCTEKWRTSFHTDVLSKSKQIFLRVFSSLHRKLYTIFQPPFFPIERCQDILIKLLTLSAGSVTIFFSGEERA